MYTGGATVVVDVVDVVVEVVVVGGTVVVVDVVVVGGTVVVVVVVVGATVVVVDTSASSPLHAVPNNGVRARSAIKERRFIF